MSSLNPMSSIRSASSSTKNFTDLKLIERVLMKKITPPPYKINSSENPLQKTIMQKHFLNIFVFKTIPDDVPVDEVE